MKPDFSVSADITQTRDLKEIVRSEGFHAGVGLNWVNIPYGLAFNTEIPISNGGGGTSYAVPGFETFSVTKLFVEKMTIVSSIDAQIRIQYNANAPFIDPITNSANSNYPLGDETIELKAYQPYIINLDDFLFGNFVLRIGAYRTSVTTTQFDIKIGLSGYSVYNDIDPYALSIIRMEGDSIVRGTGPTDVRSHYVKMLKEWLLTRGIWARMSVVAIGGQNSGQMENARKWGFLSRGRVFNMGIYSLSVNDASSNADLTLMLNQYEQSARNRAIQFKANNPKSPYIILGGTPVENNTVESRLVQYRARGLKVQQDLTNEGYSDIHFVDMVDVFDRTNPANYASSDTAGNRVHPSNPAQVLITNRLTSYIISQNLLNKIKA